MTRQTLGWDRLRGETHPEIGLTHVDADQLVQRTACGTQRARTSTWAQLEAIGDASPADRCRSGAAGSGQTIHARADLSLLTEGHCHHNLELSRGPSVDKMDAHDGEPPEPVKAGGVREAAAADNAEEGSV